MKRISRRPDALARRAALAAALVLALALAGCAAFGASSSGPGIPEQPTQDLAAKAAKAWTGDDFSQSELLYSRLLERRDLDAQARAQALDRLAESALKNRHYYQAKLALDRLAAKDEAVLTTWRWHNLYFATLAALGRPELVEGHRIWLAGHRELPYAIRSRAALAFAAIYAHGGDGARAAAMLVAARKSAPNAAAKTAFEAECAARLRDLPSDDLLVLLRAVGGSSADAFPQDLIRREVFRRGLTSRAENRPALAPAPTSGAPVLLAQADARNAGSDAPAALLPAPAGKTLRIGLALPLSGRFGSTGRKVLRGASAAQTALAAEGRNVRITAVNTDAEGWREQLNALPASVTVVGGPLMNPEALRQLAAQGELSRRAVFAFLPDLGGVEEGRQAWRFFPSSRDQMHALVTLASEDLGIHSAAILAPNNAYGQHMAELFRSEAKARGLRLAASEYYPPGRHTLWTGSVARLLGAPAKFRHRRNKPLPMPNFGAVFIPEDWTQSEMLASDIYFYEGEHLLLLGTDLWSVGMDNAREIDDSYFQRAACPGAWWPETRGARALQKIMDERGLGQADFWTALGYDFVRLAAHLDIRPGWTPQDVNAALSAADDMDYSMAPLHWDAQGLASQTMFLFAPHKEGKALVDPEALRQSIAKTRALRESRLARRPKKK